jgi:hypothetical protein
MLTSSAFEKRENLSQNYFKHARVKVAFRTNNSVGKLLRNKNQTHNNNNKHLNLGVYCVTSSECANGYVGQTGRNFSTRFSEHVQAFPNEL